MDIDILQRPGAGILEFVRHACQRNDDLPFDRLEHFAAHGEARPTLADDESFGVGMAMQPRSAADSLGVIEDHRNAGPMRPALPFS